MKGLCSFCIIPLLFIATYSAGRSANLKIPEPGSYFSYPDPVTDTVSPPVPAYTVREIFENNRPVSPQLSVAIRTNLLADIILMPNIGAEIPLSNSFSLGGDFIYAYWRHNNRRAIQTIQGNLECRYWFGRRSQIQKPKILWERWNQMLTGWNAGVYLTRGGRYDVQWNSGWQGDGFWSAGISGGCAIPLSSRFNLDFSLAAGFFFTPEVRHYGPPQEGHLIWRETRYNVTRFSLTKARVSLVWLIHKNK